MALERREWGNFYGYLVSVKEDGKVVAEGPAAWPSCRPASSAPTSSTPAQELEKKDIGAINHGLERLRLHGRKLELDGKLDAAAQADMDAERAELNAATRPSKSAWRPARRFNRDSLVARDANGRKWKSAWQSGSRLSAERHVTDDQDRLLLQQGLGVPQRRPA
jgi:phosphate transport system permease protein